MVEYVKTCNQYLCKLNFGYIFSSIVVSLFAGETLIFEKLCLGEFPSTWRSDDKNLEKSFAWDVSKNEQIQFFDLQMYFPVILTP